MNNEPYSYKSDVWSLGCVLYELASLKHAFDAGNMCALVLSILRGKYPPLPRHFSAGLAQLVDAMLQLEPARRPDMAQVLRTRVVRDALRRAILLREILGAPKGLQSAPNPTIFSPL